MSELKPVICPQCGLGNPAGALACAECHALFGSSCARCGQPAASSARFCSACGDPLAGVNAGPPGHVDSAGERRQITVMFCDMVGSTEMARQLDEEDYHEVVRLYQDAVVNAVTQFKGHVAQYLGDGVVAYFGWPVAYGDDPERAVRAGLEIMAALERVNRNLREDRKLAARVGVHTGRAVLGEIGAGARRETAALGETPNVAARAQNLAPAGGVVITEATNHLVGGRFVVEPMGGFAMKGLVQPVILYRVRQATGVRDRLQARSEGGSFVGRRAELGLLTEQWRRAQRGTGRVVLIRGEPGIGKSRLLREFAATLQPEVHTWIEGFCAPFFTNTPFFPLIEGFERAFAKPADKSRAAVVARLRQSLTDLAPRLDYAVPIIAEMLNLPLPPGYAPILLSPDQKRRRFIEAIADWMLEIARLQPFVVVLEDIQWADPSTLELAEYLIDRSRGSALMLICTCRPDFTPFWSGDADSSHIALNRLSREETITLARAAEVAAGGSGTQVDLVAERSGGVPLFVEELARVVAERGATRLLADDIPATLADLLTARLDATGDAKEVAQVASIFGRQFVYRVLREVAATSDERLGASLRKLVEADLILASGAPPDARYVFKHALVRDVAYESLLRSRRRALHNAAARALGDQSEPEMLAYHHGAAGNLDQASRAWQLAGDLTARHGAMIEAAAHYAKALEALAHLADSDGRDQREMSLRMSHASMLSATKGLAAPEAESAYQRLRELGSRIHPNRSAALLGLWQMHVTRGEARAAETFAEQRLKIAESEGSAPALCWSHLALGMTMFHSGRLAASIEHLRQAVNCYTSGDSRAKAFDAGPLAMAYLAVAFVLTGEIEQGRAQSAAAIRGARELESPPTLAYCMLNTAALHWFLHEPGAALRVAREGAELARAHALEQLASGLEVYAGWAAMALDRQPDAPERVRRAIAQWLANGQRLPHAWFLSILASVCAASGETVEAAAILDEAAGAVGEMLLEETIVLCARAELLTAAGDSGAAQAAWRATIASARQNGARLYEVRGTLGLVKTLVASGALGDARALMARLADDREAPWAADGLREAKRLLGDPLN
jgi:class 3 adenylate cyclase/tetratricopeptide (TPR) repeat protein